MALGSSIIIWAILAFVLVAFFGAIIGMFNSLVGLKNDIKKSWSNIDVLLKQRNDELPNLISTVKGYMKHEKTLLEAITTMRTQVMQATTKQGKAKAASMLSDSLKSLFAVAENYPTLRANENFLILQQRITGLENAIADRREFYNDAVTTYNTKIHSIPDMLIAKMFGYKDETLFSIDEGEKEVVEVGF